MPGDATAVFDQVSAHDSNSLLRPDMVTLILTNTEGRGPNVMTAAWWMVAGYGPFRYLLSVDHKTYTYELIEENPEFVMAVPTAELIDAVALCGLVSGRAVDKLTHLDLETVPGQSVDVPLLREAVGNIECRVTASFDHEGNTYYFAAVETAHVQPGGLDGRLLSLKTDPLAYMGSDYLDAGGKARFYVDLDGCDLRWVGDEQALAGISEDPP